MSKNGTSAPPAENCHSTPESAALSPGERVSRDGVFISRRVTGEGSFSRNALLAQVYSPLVCLCFLGAWSVRGRPQGPPLQREFTALREDHGPRSFSAFSISSKADFATSQGRGSVESRA